MKSAVLLVTLLGACASPSPSPEDVVGPFTGETHRYIVDSFTLPHNSDEARALGDDLSGDDVVDNGVGLLIGSLSSYDDVTVHGADMLAAGTIISSVEIVADDLSNDDTVSVLYIGADGAPSTAVGGTLVNGVFTSNRTRATGVPGAAELHLPVYQDADPSVLSLVGVEIDLMPDGDGFDGIIRGGVLGDEGLQVAARGMSEMVTADPGGHLGMIRIFDTNHDFAVTPEEVAVNNLMKSLCYPDVDLRLEHANEPVLSAGIGIHLRPCDAGNCNATTAFDRCFDRILDGDETDIDCGGSCRSCEAGATCTTGLDCETLTCPGGTCGPSSCSNGVRDGAEGGIDCGGNCPTMCAP